MKYESREDYQISSLYAIFHGGRGHYYLGLSPAHFRKQKQYLNLFFRIS